jgi:hypothetical protein
MARPAGIWIVERTAQPKFPYRLQIITPSGEPLVLRAQDRWPAANRNIFCLREKEAPDADEELEEVERVPILAVQKRGVRMSIVLDRARYKRCDFLFLTKGYKNQPGAVYEQIYWQTQRSMSQRRPTVVPVSLRAAKGLEICIASDERYPWSFPNSAVTKAKLPCGDYALMTEGEIRAVVERKTFDNLLADFGVMPVLHERLLELSTYEHNALVVEAPYEDFLNPAKLHHYSASFCAAAIADLYALHPGLRVVFCANRKTANQWTAAFFAAVAHIEPEASSQMPTGLP